MADESKWPEWLRDQSLLKLIVIVHDPEEYSEDPLAIVSNISKLYPTALLRINSLPEHSTPAVSDLWGPYISLQTAMNPQSSPTEPIQASVESFAFLEESPPTPPHKPVRGARLDQKDINGTITFIRDFVLKQVTDCMANHVKEWDRDVFAVRRGLSGRLFKVGLKYFGKNNPLESSTFSPNSPEMILRRMADHAFTLRDYKTALSVYEFVKKDFASNEKYIKFYAGVQEMIAITSMMMTDSPKVSVETLLESATQGYKTAKMPLFAARSVVWMVELIKNHELYKDAAHILVHMTGEDSDLKSALFLEHAAVLYLRTPVPMWRKYVFHLVLAGHRFSKCNQREHAKRCYSTALGVFADSGWSLIEDHVYFALGRHALHLEQTQESFEFLIKLLRKSRSTSNAQRAYLSEFLFVYQQLKPEGLVDKVLTLLVPTLVDSSVLVSIQDLGVGTRSQVAGDDEIWDRLEADAVESLFVRVGAKLARNKTKAGTTTSSFLKSSCAVGEPVFVSFEWRNPLQVAIPINNLFLECTFKSTVPLVSELDEMSLEPMTVLDSDDFEVEVVPDVALDANEKRVIKLKVIPKREGEMLILGIRYTLSGLVQTLKRFQKPINVSDEAGGLVGDLERVDVPVKVVVTSAMPVLNVQVHQLTESLFAGEVRDLTLELHNKGGKGLCSLIVKVSDPNVLAFGDPNSEVAPDYAPPSPTSGTRILESWTVNNGLEDPSITKLGLPDVSQPATPGSGDWLSRGVLPASQTTLVPMWIRGSKPGKHLIRLLFLYQSVDRSDRASYRVFRKTVVVNVFPSLKINAFLRPSLKSMDDFVMGLEIENVSNADVAVRQVSLISPLWALDWLSLNDQAMNTKLGSHQSFFKYVSVKKANQMDRIHIPKTPEMYSTYAIEKLILVEDPIKDSQTPISLCISSLASEGQATQTSTFPFETLTNNSRVVSRLSSLQSQYPQLSPKQIKAIFPLYWSDDIELVVFWEAADKRGYLVVSAVNLALYNPLPLSIWFANGLDEKSLGGKALYAATVRERKALVANVLKLKQKEGSPVRVLVRADHQVDLNGTSYKVLPISVSLGNTSWMNVAEYSFQAELPFDKSEGGVPFSWIGETHFKGVLNPGEQTSFQLQACLRGPGSFDVNRWSLSVVLKMCDEARVTPFSKTWKQDHGVVFLQTPSLGHHVLVT